MPIPVYKSHSTGAVRTSYLMSDLSIQAMRDRLPVNVSEFPVNRVAGGNWSATLSGQVFGSSIAEALLAGYIKARTADVPFVGVANTAAAGACDIVLVSLNSPVGNAGVDSERLTRAALDGSMSSREPFYGGKVLYHANTATGITGDTDGTGVQLGAIPAGSEGIFVFVNPHWPTLGGTAVGTWTLEHSVDNTFAAPTTAVETTGTNPWTPTAGTPDYMVVTIDGDTTAITDTWWRVTFTTITGTIYPGTYGAITTKDW